jgi:secondary thiamine-phosphate synthase enzyme
MSSTRSSLSAPSSVPANSIVSSLLTVQTRGAGFVDLGNDVAKFVREARAREGAVTLFIRHTSASLTIQENADPTVLADLTTALGRLAPENAGWRHDTEGPDDMPAHIKAMLNGVSLHVPVTDGRMGLGTWQGIYVAEHRTQPHHREVTLQFLGSCGGPKVDHAG